MAYPVGYLVISLSQRMWREARLAPKERKFGRIYPAPINWTMR